MTRKQKVLNWNATWSNRDFLRTLTPALLTDGLRIEGGI
ncbi:hypothetical protein ABIB82_006411 [Bradyrhizobium sp. i1.8.4]